MPIKFNDRTTVCVDKQDLRRKLALLVGSDISFHQMYISSTCQLTRKLDQKVVQQLRKELVIFSENDQSQDYPEQQEFLRGLGLQ